MNVFSPAYIGTVFKAKLKQLLNTLPFYKSDSYTCFLIVGHPRTGTSLLHTYLNSHVNVLSLNEPLNKLSDNKDLFKKYSKIIRAVGFKYFYEYTNDSTRKDILIQLLKDKQVKIIQIERKNYLRTYVSRCIAEKTNVWSSVGSSLSSIEDKKIILTKEQCLQAFSEYKKDETAAEEIFKKYDAVVFKIEYETLVAMPNESMFAIQYFLGVTQDVPRSLLVRQNAEPIHQLIKNYDDLKRSFSGTAFEIFFEE